GAFENQGQACIAGSRLLVQRSVHDELVARLNERTAALRVGPGWDDGVTVGPLVSAEQLQRVLGYVRGAAQEGAQVSAAGGALAGAAGGRAGGAFDRSAGGGASDGSATDPRAPFAGAPGHFMAPTVVAGVTRAMTIFREEVFGPVVTVT